MIPQVPEETWRREGGETFSFKGVQFLVLLRQLKSIAYMVW